MQWWVIGLWAVAAAVASLFVLVLHLKYGRTLKAMDDPELNKERLFELIDRPVSLYHEFKEEPSDQGPERPPGGGEFSN